MCCWSLSSFKSELSGTGQGTTSSVVIGKSKVRGGIHVCGRQGSLARAPHGAGSGAGSVCFLGACSCIRDPLAEWWGGAVHGSGLTNNTAVWDIRRTRTTHSRMSKRRPLERSGRLITTFPRSPTQCRSHARVTIVSSTVASLSWIGLDGLNVMTGSGLGQGR